MTNKRALILTAAVLVLTIAVAGFAYTIYQERDRLPEQGESAGGLSSLALPDVADFTVYDADGNEVELADYAGSYLVVNFWASWCGPCVTEMPYFAQAAQEYADYNVKFLFVNMTTTPRETVDSAKAFVESLDYDIEALYDLDGNAERAQGIVGYPTTIFVTSDGQQYYRQIGMMGEEELSDKICEMTGVCLIKEE